MERGKFGFVVVYHREATCVNLRHVICLADPYDPEAVKEWYYRDYHRFPDDTFHFCKDAKEMREFVKKIESGEVCASDF